MIAKGKPAQRYSPAYEPSTFFQQRPESPVFILELMSLLSGVTDRPIKIEYNKIAVSMVDQQIALCQSEFQKNNIYRSQGRKLVALLARHVKECNDEEIKRRFKELKAHIRACGMVITGVSRTDETDESDTYKFTTMTGFHKDPMDVQIELTREHMLLGKEMARENGYSSTNCTAEDLFFELFEIASDLKLVGLNDAIEIDNSAYNITNITETQKKLAQAYGGRA